MRLNIKLRLKKLNFCKFKPVSVKLSVGTAYKFTKRQKFWDFWAFSRSWCSIYRQNDTLKNVWKNIFGRLFLLSKTMILWPILKLWMFLFVGQKQLVLIDTFHSIRFNSNLNSRKSTFSVFFGIKWIFLYIKKIILILYNLFEKKLCKLLKRPI